MSRWPAILAMGVFAAMQAMACALAAPPAPEVPAAAAQEAEKLAAQPPVGAGKVGKTDASGRKQRGKASYYATKFNHRKMADGRRFDPNTNVAANKTLPLGSVAKVTNLENGKTATVRVQDRGPYVQSRVVDLAPKVAENLDIKQQGVAPVEVKPITVPKPDGTVKLGAGAAESSPAEVRQAIETTRQLTGNPDAPVAP
jgi:rare lipoprotein A